MLKDYSLVCLDCGEGIPLGKVISIKYGNVQEKTFGFSGITNNDEPWSILELTAAQIQHFLMHHRLHELRVLPQGAEKHTTSGDFPKKWVDYDDIGSYLAIKLEKPRPEMEVDHLSQEVIEKLKSF